MISKKIYHNDLFDFMKCYYNIFPESSITNFILISKKVIAILLLVLYISIQIFILKLIKKRKNLSDGKKFIDKCLNSSFIKNNYFIQESPIISVIIPAYNCEKTILFPLISIQNQNIYNFEIILINDFSQDNTSEILQRFQKKDKRLKIINNKKNMGTLYSRCIATLISKGEYIFALDNDDMIFGEDILDYTYKQAKKYDHDIVGFKAISVKSYSDNIRKMKDLEKYSYENNLIIKQPELSTWIISINGKFKPHDVTLWGKIIKTKIYIKAINLLGKQRYSIYMSWAEDTSMNFIIFNIAESFIFIHKYGILHLISTSTASSLQPINNKFFGILFLLDIIYDFSKNNEEKIYSVYAALYIMKYYYKDKHYINKNNLSYLKTIIYKIKKSKYISDKNKNIVLKEFQKFFFESNYNELKIF